MTPSDAVMAKGVRLHEAGKVGEPVDAKVYPVEGDTGRWEVTVYADPERPPACTCPATGTCSHKYATARYRALGG